MGLFDDLFGGLFDFNEDGETDAGEEWTGLNIFGECTKEDSDFDIEPEDYETEEEKTAAEKRCDISKNARRKIAAEIISNQYLYFDYEIKRSEFILENADTITAADYLSPEDGFLYAQAIKDHFSLPVTLPDEDERREFKLYESIEKIAAKDTPLALKVWNWCAEQFLPYGVYDEGCSDDLTYSVISRLPSADCAVPLVHYFDEHTPFCVNIIGHLTAVERGYAYVITAAIKEKLPQTAKALFDGALKKVKGNWSEINNFIGNLLCCCKNYKETETIDFLEKEFLPRIEAIDGETARGAIEMWERDIARYKSIVGAKPLAAQKEKRAKEREALADKSIYTYCGVRFPGSGRIYYYMTDDSGIHIGDSVLVPVGNDRQEIAAKVASVGQYSRISVPFPVERTRAVIRKIEESNYGK